MASYDPAAVSSSADPTAAAMSTSAASVSAKGKGGAMYHCDYCLSEDMEVLTERGFMSRAAVFAACPELVACMAPAPMQSNVVLSFGGAVSRSRTSSLCWKPSPAEEAADKAAGIRHDRLKAQYGPSTVQLRDSKGRYGHQCAACGECVWSSTQAGSSAALSRHIRDDHSNEARPAGQLSPVSTASTGRRPSLSTAPVEKPPMARPASMPVGHVARPVSAPSDGRRGSLTYAFTPRDRSTSATFRDSMGDAYEAATGKSMDATTYEAATVAELRSDVMTAVVDDVSVGDAEGAIYAARPSPAASWSPLRFASFDPSTGHLVYLPATALVVNSVTSLVEFTHATEAPHWGVDADEYGLTPDQRVRMQAQSDRHRNGEKVIERFRLEPASNGVSVLVDPQHDMFVRLGTGDTGEHTQWKSTDYHKVKAGALVSDNVRQRVQLTGRAPAGLAASADAEELPFAPVLGLKTDEQLTAFLQLYGYWLGDGCLDTQNRSVLFCPKKDDDKMWVLDRLAELELTVKSGGIGHPGSDFANGQLMIRIKDQRWINYFFGEYGPKDRVYSASSSAATHTGLTTFDIESVKWFWLWVWRLRKHRARLVLAGLRMAGGSEATDHNVIYASSVGFREEVVRLALHAGYSARFNLEHKKGAHCGYSDVDGTAVIAQHDGWVVSYSDYESTADPVLCNHKDIQRCDVPSGVPVPVWCVTVPPHNLIITRRVNRNAEGVVTQASRPIVAGNCRKDISNVVRIRCAECADFDLCLDCFCAGVRVPPHVPSHAYRVIEHVRQPLFDEKWGADEELLLLEAIETFGFGNWSDIADHVSTKTKSECELHYNHTYLSAATAPLPDIANALTKQQQQQQPEPQQHDSMKQEGGATQQAADAVKAESDASSAIATVASSSSGVVDPKESKSTATSLVTSSVLSSSSSSSNSPSAASRPVKPAPAPLASKPKPKSGLGHLVGYIPNRGDFDQEYENDCELLLADMEFKDEDTKWEKELKLKVIDIYNSKLDARLERKKFILERGLLERKEKKRGKEEREIWNNMRVFARFHSAEEHEQFVQGLVNEARLRRRIERLQQWRMNGVKTLKDGERYEEEKKRRDERKKNQHAMAGGAVGGSTSFGSSLSSSSLSSTSKKRPTESGGSSEEAGSAPSKASKSSASASPSPTPATLPPFPIDSCEQSELLSEREKQLCATLHLLPVHYLAIKQRLMTECFVRGFIKEGQARQLIRIDVNKTKV